MTLASRPEIADETSLTALARLELRYRQLVESAADGIFTLDSQGTLTAANESLERASGRTRAELIGMLFADLVDPRDRALADEAVHEAIEGQWRRVDLRYAGPNNAVRHCSVTLTPTAPELNQTGVVLGVVRDTTDEKRLAEQLIQQEKLAAVGQLVSGVAHELNNPLASVMAFAQLLLAAPDGAPCDRRAVEAIHQETKRAARIVSNLLTFARQYQHERCVADLNRVVEDTLDLRRYALRNENIDVETRLDPLLPLTWADPHQLQQVVLNLVTNAEQAMIAWPDAELRRLHVATEQRDDTLVIRVTDTGPGIAPEHLSRIFNPFFTTKPVGEGTGLGLSISDGIVREHGGRMRVESHPGYGATFVVELPYVAPPDEDVDDRLPDVESPHGRFLYVDSGRHPAKR